MMAAACAVRLYLLLAYVWLLSGFVDFVQVFASPTRLVVFPIDYRGTHQIRDRPSVIINDASGNVAVFNSQTQQPISQGAASDGGGLNFDVPAVLWIAFSFVVGAPLAVAGVRGWKFTIGAAIGLSAAVCGEFGEVATCKFSPLTHSLAWAAFVNTVPSQGVPDIAIALIVLGIFILGSIIGFFEFGRIAGITLIGVNGGLALGVRVVMFRNRLLINSFTVNWFLIAGCGAGGVLFIMWKQRAAIVS